MVQFQPRKVTMPKRYHPALVTLHWITAFLLIGALLGGTFNMADVPNTDPAKVDTLRMHMIVGGSALILLLVRLVLRHRTARPAPVDSGSPALNRVASATHLGLYALAIAMAASGVALSMMSGLPDAVFGTAPLPASFWDYAPRYAHGIIAKLLGALIVLHIAAALWHQFKKRDGIFARMWFGAR